MTEPALPYPGSGTHWGVLLPTALIAAPSSVLHATFQHDDWL